MTEHQLKCWQPFFQHVKSGVKKFDIRKNDRNYQVGDVIVLREFDTEKQIEVSDSAPIRANITYMTDFEQKEGYVVLGIETIGDGDEQS